MAQGISPRLPLILDQNDGAFALIKDYQEMVKQNLKMLILTCPGERIMDMNFGVGLRNFLFLENVASIRNDVSAKIYEQVAIYMPYIEIEDIQIGITDEDYDSNMINIKLFYKIIPLGTSDLLTMDNKLT